MLKIENLTVEREGKKIIEGFSLEVNPGEIHAIMGPNGAGKSTLAKALAGHPDYEITEGTVLLDGVNLLALEPDERSKQGLFMSFQYPIEVPGVSNFQFLLKAYNEKRKFIQLPEISTQEFSSIMDEALKSMEMKIEFKNRNLNEGFSGGEKKRNEILQMTLLDPIVAILDETDSGLDIDAMKVVAQGINHFMTPKKSIILITHYQRLLDYVEPTFVHVMVDGKICKSGDKTLALELEAKGYQPFQTSNNLF